MLWAKPPLSWKHMKRSEWPLMSGAHIYGSTRQDASGGKAVGIHLRGRKCPTNADVSGAVHVAHAINAASLNVADALGRTAYVIKKAERKETARPSTMETVTHLSHK